jgi:hypothetical protein
MFRVGYCSSSSGALTVFAASGLHTHVVTGRSQVWVRTGWAVCRSKHVEPLMNGGIINSVTRLHLVGYFYWVILRWTDPWILKKWNYFYYICDFHRSKKFVAVRIAIRYGLEGLGIESRFWKSIFAPIHTDPKAQPAVYTGGAGFFLTIQCPERGADHESPCSTEFANFSDLHLCLLSVFVQACHKVNFWHLQIYIVLCINTYQIYQKLDDDFYVCTVHF